MDKSELAKRDGSAANQGAAFSEDEMNNAFSEN